MTPALKAVAFTVESYAEVDTTMAVARQRALAGAPSGTVIEAGMQRAGRGRRGRAWFSPHGAGLFLTAILRTPAAPPRGAPLFLLSIVVGVAVARAVRGLGVREALLKWPNDVVVGERKLCGILLESASEASGGDGVAPNSPGSAKSGLGARAQSSAAGPVPSCAEGPVPSSGEGPVVLAGIGLNLWPRGMLVERLGSLPREIDTIYIGLEDALAQDTVRAGEPLRAQALAAIVRELERAYEEWLVQGPAPAIAAWRMLDALRGRRVRAEAPSGAVIGSASGIDDSGALLVQTQAGEVRITAGEVERLRPT